MQDKFLKEYVVICYAVHNLEVASCNMFDTWEEACSFLKKDAKKNI